MQSSAEAKRKCNFSNSGRPPHLIMGFGFADYGKAKPFIEAPGWIHFHHLQRNGTCLCLASVSNTSMTAVPSRLF